MDTTEFSEGQYITAEVVKNSPSKLCVVIDEAKPERTEFGERLQVKVQLDQKTKIWRLNKDTVKNLHQFGVDSKFWVGKQVKLMVVTVKGKDCVIGVPVLSSPEKTSEARMAAVTDL